MSTHATDPTTRAPLPGAPVVPVGFHVFTLEDADGKPHRYEVQPHPPTEGTNIMLALIAFGAEPFAAVVSSAFAVEDFFAGGATLGDALDLDVEGLVGKLDWSRVGADLKKSILSMPLGSMIRDILARTWRDGSPLSNDVHYNAAYTRNYLEQMRAVWEVANVNRFFPQLSTSEKGGTKKIIEG